MRFDTEARPPDAASSLTSLSPILLSKRGSDFERLRVLLEQQFVSRLAARDAAPSSDEQATVSPSVGERQLMVANRGQISLYCYLLRAAGFNTAALQPGRSGERARAAVTSFLDDVLLQLLGCGCDELVISTAVSAVVAVSSATDVHVLMEHLLQVRTLLCL